MSTPEAPQTHKEPGFIKRHLGGIALFATVATLATAGGLKINHETTEYNDRVNAAQHTFNAALNQEEIARDDMLASDTSNKITEYQDSIDFFEAKELPDYDVDGKILGKQVPYAIGLPKYMTDERREAIAALGADFSKQELDKEEDWAKKLGNPFDRVEYQRNNIKVDAQEDEEGITWVNPVQLKKFKQLTVAIDKAQEAAIPGYMAASARSIAAKNDAHQHLIDTLADRNILVVK